MKHIFMKTVLAALLMGGVTTSCINDLNISSIDPQSSSSYGDMELLAKIYGTLGLTGQRGPAGNGDISSDEGESGFYRTTFNLQELCTDECVWAWQTDADIPQITNIEWTSSSPRVQWAFQRLAFDVTLCNFYLTNTEEKAEDPQYKLYRAEVRFLRALHLWYFLDLWGKAPFKTTYDIYELPVEKAGKELYDWIDQELTEIEPQMAEVGEFNNSSNFGRADRGAAYMLHARLALNSEVYTNGAVKDYQKAIDYCNLLEGKYELSTADKNGYTGYEQVFMADNDENPQAMKEIILPIRQDGVKTKCYSGSNYLVSSTRITGMPYMGTNNGWSCNFARAALVKKFFSNLDDCPLATEKAPDNSTEADIIALDEAAGTTTKDVQRKANDDRALFYSGCGGGLRSIEFEQITGFNSGLSIVKWSNIRTDGAPTSHVEFPDVDIPLIRYAEMYLTRAEAKYRLTGDPQQARADIEVLRNRAGASTPATITEQFIIDEWCREFYMEGRRRSDLNRFGLFTGDKYIWDFKGGVAEGKSVADYFKVYPIPADDIRGNENLSQNEGY
ncbi:starch-binding outer membrane lipoprotein SusD [uncultured Bacteroides sp.]|uniref:starch-binding outer membrane lipoprotein SusD n=1 Tax=uncultured Bacteroides sp. TaxID=162156 RepID=UPI0026356908|nr:starch-binding outer membrane lipoprotein SusD [uncultured Bacteroides sp.]